MKKYFFILFIPFLFSGCVMIDSDFQGLTHPNQSVDYTVFASFEGPRQDDFKENVAPDVFEERSIQLVNDASVADFHIRFKIDYEWVQPEKTLYQAVGDLTLIVPAKQYDAYYDYEMIVYDSNGKQVWTAKRELQETEYIQLVAVLAFPISGYPYFKGKFAYRDAYNDLLDQAIRENAFAPAF